MRVISIGDLVTDFYYKDGKLQGVNGGMTSHNIVANLSKWKFETSVFGVCGNDDAGLLAIKSLSDLKVDTSNIIKMDDIDTRCFHVSYNTKGNKLSFTSKKRCPNCNEKNWYEESRINPSFIINNIIDDDILVIDNLNEKNQEIIDNTHNKVMLDLGQYFEFEKISTDKIIEKLNSKFEIINLNERVAKYLLGRFNLSNYCDLYKVVSPKLLTITLGKKGALFIIDSEEFSFSPTGLADEVDPTGAGDAFFSSVIRDVINNKFIYDKTKFEKWYNKSLKLTSRVVTKFGARGHLHSLYKIRAITADCICKKFELVERKQIKRCNININNLEVRINSALDSNAYLKIKNMDFNEEENYIFTGTGGSFAGAKFASIVINELYGSNTYALMPRDVFYRNNKFIDRIFLFSYSGTTNDLLESSRIFNENNIVLITKADKKKTAEKTGFKKNNIISYSTSTSRGKEKGFLSFEGAIVPATLFFNYYVNKSGLKIDVREFVRNSVDYWKKYFDDYFKSNDVKTIFNNVINIFMGDYCSCAGIDTESKIIESGVFNCLLHEKKNFSHGRFINYENLNNKTNIYYKQLVTGKYEKKLLEYLKNGNNLIIESRYDGVLCEYDLLLASQYLIYYIGKYLDIDVSKPSYSDESMKLYFYKGELN